MNKELKKLEKKNQLVELAKLKAQIRLNDELWVEKIKELANRIDQTAGPMCNTPWILFELTELANNG